MHPINKNTLHYYARTNEKFIDGKVRAVVAEKHAR